MIKWREEGDDEMKQKSKRIAVQFSLRQPPTFPNDSQRNTKTRREARLENDKKFLAHNSLQRVRRISQLRVYILKLFFSELNSNLAVYCIQLKLDSLCSHTQATTICERRSYRIHLLAFTHSKPVTRCNGERRSSARRRRRKNAAKTKLIDKQLGRAGETRLC